MASKAQKLSIEVPDVVRASLERMALERNMPREDLINEAIVRYVDDESDYLVAIDEALAEAESGDFISGDRVIAWIKSLGTENELPMPEPDIVPGKDT